MKQRGLISGCAQVQALLTEQGEKKAHVAALEATTKKSMWRADLDEFEAEYNAWLAEEWAEANQTPDIVAGKCKKKAAPKRKAAKLSVDSDDWAPAAQAVAAAKSAAKKVAGPAYGASTSKAAAATAKPAAGGASTSKAAPKKKAAASTTKAVTTSQDLKLADVFAKAATKKKAARPREEDSFSDSPVCFVPRSMS